MCLCVCKHRHDCVRLCVALWEHCISDSSSTASEVCVRCIMWKCVCTVLRCVWGALCGSVCAQCWCVWVALCWWVHACAQCWCVCMCEVQYVDVCVHGAEVCVWGAVCWCVRARCWCAQAGVLVLMLVVLSLRFVATPSSGFIIPLLLFHTMKYVGCFLLFTRLVFLPRFGLKPFMNPCHPKYKHSLSIVFWLSVHSQHNIFPTTLMTM